MRRSDRDMNSDRQRFLVYFSVDYIRPLVGDRKSE